MPKIALSILFIFKLIELNGQTDKGLIANFTFNRGNTLNEVSKITAHAYGITWTADRFGNDRSAVYLQGASNSYINIGTSNTLKPKNGTISLWAKIDRPVYKGFGADNNPIIYTRANAKSDFNEAFIITYQYSLQKLCCNTTSSETKQSQLFQSQTSSLQQWYHVAITFDYKSLCFYVNGILEGKCTKGFESNYLMGDSIIVGLRNEGRNKRYFRGSVDDIEIYDKVLSPEEILNLYNSPNPDKSAGIYKWISLCLAALIFVVLIVRLINWRIHKAISNEKEKNKLRNNWYEQENKVLTAQMDPHFIFNSLNTIQKFIVNSDNEKAQIYLTKFSRLLRMILESNVKDRISLKEEIEIIRQYLEIEALRFNNVFTYKIEVEEGVNTASTDIPRFLIQPFIENAIWHGLLPKVGDKSVTISFNQLNDKTLRVIIDDNGIGREEAKKNTPLKKNKSIAINFIQQRLAVMCKIYQCNYGIVISDKTDESGESTGTKIIATLPILKD